MDEEKGRFDKHKVVEAVQRNQVPDGTRIMTSTWACKKKSNGTYRVRLNLRGFLQVEGEHYDAHSISSPVVTIITIHIVLTMLTIIVDWYAVLADVQGAFLLGDWESDRQIYMEVPKGWTHHYPVGTVLRLLKTAYGAKQSAKRYWILRLTVMDEMGFTRSKADPCLYYKWHPEHGLLLMMSFIDDVCIAGTRVGVEQVKAELFTHFDCDDTGEMKEYVGNKVDRDHKVKNPAVPGTVLQPTENKLSPEDLFTYRSGTGKLLHLMKWSRPEIANSVRELSCYMTGAGMSHMKAMYRVFNYCLNTSTRGKVFKPRRTCLSKDIEEFEFEIYGYSDSDYVKDPVKRRSVSGYSSFLEGCVVNTKSRMQPITALSVMEAELIAATECAQDLVFIKNVLESIGLKVRLPMNLHIDNSGCIDLICNWSAGGRTCHIDTHMYFLRELKEEEPKSIVMPLYCPTALNRSDIFTKKNDTNTFEEHTSVYCMDEVFD
jgi:Reverse transcriptase (RNA-dependent DNA polymerase)